MEGVSPERRWEASRGPGVVGLTIANTMSYMAELVKAGVVGKGAFLAISEGDTPGPV
jgi:hypothetical protein